MRKHPIQRFALLLCLVCCSPAISFAQAGGRSVISPATMPTGIAFFMTPAIQVDPPGALEKAVADAKSSADNSWMLASSALVPLMTGPGLALFYGGLGRKKNVLSTMKQRF